MSKLMLYLGLIWTFLCLFRSSVKTESVIEENSSASNDLYLSGLFGIHNPDPTGKTKCGTINKYDGILFAEAFRFAVKKINNDSNLLSGKKLGYKVFDTCKNVLALRGKSRLFEIISNEQRNTPVGIVGPDTSDEVIELAPVLDKFELLSVSYQASSIDLEDRTKYSNFYRTLPSDRYQTEAILDILRKFNWTYVSVISSHGNVDQKAVAELTAAVDKDNRCIAKTLTLPKLPTASDYNDTINKLKENTKAKVVVLFTTAKDVVGLFNAVREQRVAKGTWQWIGTTNIGDLMLISTELQDIAGGALTLNYVPSIENEFEDYYFSLNPRNNNYTMFVDFWESIFNCSVANTINSSINFCTGSERLQGGKGYSRIAPAYSVIDSVYAYAYAIKGIIKTRCQNVSNTSSCVNSINLGQLLYSKGLKGITYPSFQSNSNISFDKDGGVQGKYSIMNFIHTNGSYVYKTVGSWEAGILILNQSSITWVNNSNLPSKSVCSEPCKPDEAVRTVNQKCCWTCESRQYDKLPEKNAKLSLSGLYITALFGVHNSDPASKTKCGTINTQDGILFVEAFRFAINKVNNDSGLLYGNKLGYQVFDTCKNIVRLKALRQSIIINRMGNWPIGVVGPPTSDEAVLFLPVLDMFALVSVSYRASSIALENRGKFNNFYRTIPSDRYKFQAILDLLREFNWTYISCISSQGNSNDRSEFNTIIREDKRCIARNIQLKENPSSSDYDTAIVNLKEYTRAKVVILFTSPEDVVGLFKAVRRQNVSSGTFQWVGTTHWGNLNFETTELKRVAKGALTLNYQSTELTDFKKYFFSLTPQNTKYTDFRVYWEKIFNCTLSTKVGSNLKNCNGSERLEEGKGYYKYSPVDSVINSVYAYAFAIRNLLHIKCRNRLSDPACASSTNLVSPMHSDGLKNLTFQDFATGKDLTFDRYGGVLGYFQILNFVEAQSRYKYELVGTWKKAQTYRASSVLSINHSTVIFVSGIGGNLKSVCSEPCKPGQIAEKESGNENENCCWKCKSCQMNDKTVKNKCHPCGKAYKPNALRTDCLKLPEHYVEYKNPFSISAIILSGIGLVLNTLVLIMFIWFNDSRIVRASGRELCYCILVGIYCCFLTPLVFLSKPTPVICGMQRFVGGLSLSFCYAPLFLKTNRIYRIFKSAKSSFSRPSLVSPISQVVICLAISSVQILLGIVWIIGDAPKVEPRYPSHRKFVKLICKSDQYTMALNLIVCLALMLACTGYAFKTRRFPKNYNETKSIMVTMYVSCFIWGIFLPTYLYEAEFTRTYIIAMFYVVIAFVTLVGLFLPKAWLLLFPNKIEDVNMYSIENSSISLHRHRIGPKPSSMRKTVVDIKSASPEDKLRTITEVHNAEPLTEKSEQDRGSSPK